MAVLASSPACVVRGAGIPVLYASSVGDWLGLSLLSHFFNQEDLVVICFVSWTLVYCAKFIPVTLIYAAIGVSPVNSTYI